jgi:hypothetical protein
MTDLSLKDVTLSNEMTMSQRKLLSTRESTKENRSERSEKSERSHLSSPKSPRKTRDLTSGLNPINVERKRTRNQPHPRESDGNLYLETESENQRKDAYGNNIRKGPGKRQKLTFVDQISNTAFMDIVFVESYKQYNLDISKEKTKCNCNCTIF